MTTLFQICFVGLFTVGLYFVIQYLVKLLTTVNMSTTIGSIAFIVILFAIVGVVIGALPLLSLLL